MSHVRIAGSPTSSTIHRRFDFWWRWVTVNTLVEAVGIGAAALITVSVAASAGQAVSQAGPLVSMAIIVLGGTLIEGVLVGLAQGIILSRYLPALNFRRWLGMTSLGAAIAWLLGSLPSTLIDMAETQPAAASSGPDFAAIPQAIILLMAAGMGFVLGPLLAVPQWVELRKHVLKAGWWIPANCTAWAVGMTIIFAAMDLIPPSPTPIMVLTIGIGIGAAAGAAVGAIHGAVMAWLIDFPRS